MSKLSDAFGDYIAHLLRNAPPGMIQVEAEHATFMTGAAGGFAAFIDSLPDDLKTAELFEYVDRFKNDIAHELSIVEKRAIAMLNEGL